jgi:hypothetical protein
VVADIAINIYIDGRRYCSLTIPIYFRTFEDMYILFYGEITDLVWIFKIITDLVSIFKIITDLVSIGQPVTTVVPTT